jgi:hypothetical protein
MTKLTLLKVVGFILSLVATVLGTSFLKDHWDAAKLAVELVDVRLEAREKTRSIPSYDDIPNELRSNPLHGVILDKKPELDQLCNREEKVAKLAETLRQRVSGIPAGQDRDQTRKQFIADFFSDLASGNLLYDSLMQLARDQKFPKSYESKPRIKYPPYQVLKDGGQFSLSDRTPADAYGEEASLRQLNASAENQVRRWFGTASVDDLKSVLLQMGDSMKAAHDDCITTFSTNPQLSSADPFKSVVVTVLVAHRGRDSGATRDVALLEVNLPGGQGFGPRLLAFDLLGPSNGTGVHILKGFESQVLELRSNDSLIDMIKAQPAESGGELAEHVAKRLAETLKTVEGSVDAKVWLAVAGAPRAISSENVKAFGGNAIRESQRALRGAAKWSR